jgi:hypothetical protein
MSLTLSVDKQLVERARRVARAMGKSLNELVREYLRNLAGDEDAKRDMEELRALSQRCGIDLQSKGLRASEDGCCWRERCAPK